MFIVATVSAQKLSCDNYGKQALAIEAITNHELGSLLYFNDTS